MRVLIKRTFPPPFMLGLKKNARTNIWTAEQPITNVAEFVRLTSISTYLGPAVLFRGQCRIDDPLLPRIARRSGSAFSLLGEKRLLNEFKRRSYPYLPGYAQNLTDIHMLALGQHHGLETRLLDWTENALTALWFVVQHCLRASICKCRPKVNGVVWMFLPEQGDFLSEEEMDDTPFRGGMTKVFCPKHIGERIRSQAGWFTLHAHQIAKASPQKRTFVPLDENSKQRHKLRCIPIDVGSFEKIIKELARCGINAASAFPDIGGLCDSLNSSWRMGLPSD